MSKNLMVISQKVFAQASYIGRKLNKKHRKQKLATNLEAVQEKSQLSGYNSTDVDGNSMTDMEASWRADKADLSPTVESIVDCPDFDILEASLHKPIHMVYPGSLNRETTLTDNPGEFLEEKTHRNTYNAKASQLSKGVTVKDIECHTAVKLSSEKLHRKSNNVMSDTYT